ncbi:MAG TPA: hypothetical protein VN577_03930 [Terriglobales bacterium]|nr:hypothetical protein [Terriglobales bacterium]
MARNLPIIITSILVVTLFVLLVYPAIIPVNAPPTLKTFKDIFVAVLALASVLATLGLAVRTGILNPVSEHDSSVDDYCSFLCTLRC